MIVKIRVLPAGLFFHALVLLLLSVVWLPDANAAEDKILDFNVRVDINIDGSMLVTESLHFNHGGERIRHGILRILPSHWRPPYGERLLADYQLLDATLDGHSESHHEERNAESVIWRFGLADRELAKGEHTYVIRYSVTNGLIRRDGRYELMWHVTGDGWPFTIERVNFHINLPEAQWYINREGRDRRLQVLESGTRFDNVTVTPSGAITNNNFLAPHQGMIVHVAWPEKDFPTPPSFTINDAVASLIATLTWVLEFLLQIPTIITLALRHALVPDRDMLYLFIPTGLLMIYCLGYRLSRPMPRVVRLPLDKKHLPPEVTPGLASYVMEDIHCMSAFTGDLLCLVDKGLLRWEPGSEERAKARLIVLPDRNETVAALTPALQLLWRTLQKQKNGVIELSVRNQLVPANQAMNEYYSQHYARKLFYRRSRFSWGGFFAALLSLCISLFYADDFDTTLMMLFALVVVGILFALLHISLHECEQEARIPGGSPYSAWGKMSLLLLRNILLTLLFCFIFIDNQLANMPAGALLGMLSPLYFSLFYYYFILPPYTPEGERYLAKVAGLKALLRELTATSAAGTLSAAMAEQRQSLLPYALALNLDNAEQSELVRQLGEHCRWADQNGPLTWAQLSALNVMVTSAAVTDSDSPMGSGGDGGGDSGGGGGGGGDGW